MSEKIEAATAKLSYAASGSLVGVGVWTLQDWAIAVGVLATVVTTIGNLYFKHKHLELARAQVNLDRSYRDGESEEQHRCA